MGVLPEAQAEVRKRPQGTGHWLGFKWPVPCCNAIHLVATQWYKVFPVKDLSGMTTSPVRAGTLGSLGQGWFGGLSSVQPTHFLTEVPHQPQGRRRQPGTQNIFASEPLQRLREDHVGFDEDGPGRFLEPGHLHII